MIEIKRIYKSFGEKNIFENFSLTINDGDFIIFSGASGCGKTTLLNMIGSLESVDSGEILYNNVNVSNRRNQRKYLSEKVGFIFQNFALVENKSVRENLEMIRKKNRSKISIEEALTAVGMIDNIDSKIYTLSGGEQQRVALARVMVKKCELILCDEPTGSVDHENGDIIMGILDGLNKQGKTVIIVTHDEKYKNFKGRLIKI